MLVGAATPTVAWSFTRSAVRLGRRRPAAFQQLAVPAGHAASRFLRRGFAQVPNIGLAGAVRPARPAVAAHRCLATASAGPEPTGALRFVPSSIRRFTVQYGLNFVGIYLGVYWLTLLGIYSTITAGVVGPRDMMRHIESAVTKVGDVVGVPLADWLHMSDINPDAAPLMAAWMLAKPTEPPRLIVSAAITPTFTRWVRSLRSTPVDGQRALRCANSALSCSTSVRLSVCLPLVRVSAIPAAYLFTATVLCARMAIPLLATSFALEAMILAVVARKDASVLETGEKDEGGGASEGTSPDR